MSRGKSIIGALALCVLALGIVGAANASAAGLTAVTCKEAAGGAGTGNFETNHCETPEVTKGNFETAPITETTKITGESVGTTRFTATILFVNTEIRCAKAHVTGKVTNTESEGVMHAHGTELAYNYSECEASTKGNEANEACKVRMVGGPAGELHTEKLTSLTGSEHNVTFKPEGATPFWKYELLHESATAGKSCNLPASTITVEGELNGVANTEKHSHITFEPATNGNNTRANGGAAKYDGTFVYYMENPDGTPGNTVGLTTF